VRLAVVAVDVAERGPPRRWLIGLLPVRWRVAKPLGASPEVEVGVSAAERDMAAACGAAAAGLLRRRSGTSAGVTGLGGFEGDGGV